MVYACCYLFSISDGKVKISENFCITVVVLHMDGDTVLQRNQANAGRIGRPLTQPDCL